MATIDGTATTMANMGRQMDQLHSEMQKAAKDVNNNTGRILELQSKLTQMSANLNAVVSAQNKVTGAINNANRTLVQAG